MRKYIRAFALLGLFLLTALGAAQAQVGKPFAWGGNATGQLGDGTFNYRFTPDMVLNLTGVVQVASGGYYSYASAGGHSLALKSDGTVWAWGNGSWGQLGDGTIEAGGKSVPVQALNLTGVVHIAAGGLHSLAVKFDGTVWAWGLNDYGALGDGTATNRKAPVQVSGITGVVQVAAGAAHSLALKSDGTVWAWGLNNYGQLGDGSDPAIKDRSVTPVKVSGLTGVVQVASEGLYHSLALKSDGTVWAWGWNEYKQLGDGTITSRVVPVKVSGITGVVQVAGGQYHSLALKSDGTVWAWGHNPFGQLGDGTTDDKATPVQVSGITGVAQVASGGFGHSLAVKLDGTVWAWGYNNTGQLGDGTQTNGLTPIQTLSLTGMSDVAGGAFHSLAVKAVLLNTKISLSNITASYGKITLVAYLKDVSRNINLANKPLTFSLDGNVVGTASTDASGKAALLVPNPLDFGVGTHTMVAAFAGDRHYTPSTRSATLTITKAPTAISTSVFTGSPGETRNLKATLVRKVDKGSLASQTLTYKVDGDTIGTAVTDGTGKAVLAYKLETTYAVGAHTLTIEYAGDTNHNASTGAGTLTVGKASTVTDITTIFGSPGETKTLKATLRRKVDKAYLANQTLTFKIDGNVIGASVTDATGKATLSYKWSETYSTGAHTLTAEYAGDAAYIASTGAGTLTVNQAITGMLGSSAGGHIGVTITLKAKLTRKTDGALLAGKTVRFQVDGVDVGSAVTDGINATKIAYTIPFGAALGAHTVTFLFDGDVFYLSSSDSRTLTVN